MTKYIVYLHSFAGLNSLLAATVVDESPKTFSLKNTRELPYFCHHNIVRKSGLIYKLFDNPKDAIVIMRQERDARVEFEESRDKFNNTLLELLQ